MGTYDSVRSSIPQGYFDLVVCNDVIEHMQDPKKFLKDIRSKLAPGGKMIASIPNLRNAENIMELVVDGNFKYKDAGILDYTHFHLFTKRSFVEMSTECGWAVEVCRPINKMNFKRRDRHFASLAKHFIPEIKYLQIAACLKPSEA
jgi:2-polyprenyl-3-methyl-5-hydroxy-6-metoxy-1,4-benzoquinol methylase